MSSRLLRRMQGGPEINIEGAGDDEDQDREDVRAGGGAKPKAKNVNPFDLLNQQKSESSDSDIKEDDDLSSAMNTTTNNHKATTSELARMESQKRKKKKKNKKKPVNKAANLKSTCSEDNKEMDEIVKEVFGDLKQVDAATGENQGQSKKMAQERLILSVETKNLNPENEMKKMFGSRVVLAEQTARHNRRHGRQQHFRASRHSHHIVAAKPGWPNPGNTGLSMKFIESDDKGNQCFTFEHSKSYQEVQKFFYTAVESMNPEMIVNLLNNQPFHIDAMLQLSDICKMGEDTQMSTELIERAIFAMESAFHPLFSVVAGNCRLEYRRQENRALFIAVFRHIHNVGARACHRTAFELCKLLLSLDPDSDPTGVLLMIDFYALRSQQYSWIICAFEEWESTKNLSQLPNWAYSVALARFLKAQETKDKKEAEELTKKSDQDMQRALLTFPGVLLPLLDKCSVEPDGSVSQHKFFIDAQLGQSDGLKILIELFIGRSFHAWKLPEILPWLETNCKTVLAQVESQEMSSEEVVAAAERRKTRYQGVPRNIYRHVMMADIKDATTSLPRELSSVAVMAFDPLPPTDSIDLYGADVRGGEDAVRRALDDPSAIRMFFRSLLPNFDPNAPLPEGREAEELAAAVAAGAGGGAGGLRNSVNSLVEAMQELLGNLRLPEIPHEGADSEDSDDENDAEWD